MVCDLIHDAIGSNVKACAQCMGLRQIFQTHIHKSSFSAVIDLSYTQEGFSQLCKTGRTHVSLGELIFAVGEPMS